MFEQLRLLLSAFRLGEQHGCCFGCQDVLSGLGRASTLHRVLSQDLSLLLFGAVRSLQSRCSLGEVTPAWLRDVSIDRLSPAIGAIEVSALEG